MRSVPSAFVFGVVVLVGGERAAQLLSRLAQLPNHGRGRCNQAHPLTVLGEEDAHAERPLRGLKAWEHLRSGSVSSDTAHTQGA